MSSILKMSSGFDRAVHVYEEDQKQRTTPMAPDRAKSRAFGAVAMIAVLGASVVMTGGLSGVAVGAEVAFLAKPVIAGIAVYMAHQAAPFRHSIMDKLKGMSSTVPSIGSGIAGAFSRFGQAVGRLGDTLNLTEGGRAVRNDAESLKMSLGIDSMAQVKRTVGHFYGKESANSLSHEAYWLRKGIDQAVKDKINMGDRTPISYKDIETGVLKSLEKGKILGSSVEEARGKTNYLENVRMMMTKPGSFNGFDTGDFSALKDDRVINKLHERDNDRELSGPK